MCACATAHVHAHACAHTQAKMEHAAVNQSLSLIGIASAKEETAGARRGAAKREKKATPAATPAPSTSETVD